jgi:MFS family permease
MRPGVAARETAPDLACVEHLDLRTTGRHHPHRLAPARAFWLVALAFTIILLGTNVPTPLYVLYQAKWGFSAGVLTIVFAIYAAGVVIALLICGRVSDEVGRIPVLLGALTAAGASTLVFVFATGISMLLVARLLSGLAAGLTQGTATAALAELEPSGDVRRASLTSAAVTSGAVGLGPLMGGLFAEYAGWKTHLVFVVYLGLLALAIAATLLVPETVRDRGRPALRLQRLSVPAEIRAPFLSAAIVMFATFALVGLFASLVPSFLGRDLHERDHAVAGLVVFAFFSFATTAQLVLHRLATRTAMLLGFACLLVGLALLMLGLSLTRLSLFVAGTAACGIGAGLAVMGALATVNRLAPAEHRGETLSSFFVAAYVGLSVPAIGVGIASEQVGFFSATLVCSIAVAALLGGVAAHLIRGAKAVDAVRI